MNATLVHSVTVVSGGREQPDGWVLLEPGGIRRRGGGDTWRGLDLTGVRAVDGAGHVLTPGFIDIHCHGGGGVSAEDVADGADAAALLAPHRARGTTRTVLSLVSAPVPRLAERLAALSALVRTDPSVVGVHLEGPFLSQGHRGAHDPDALCVPDPSRLDRLLSAGAGALVMMTLAPELPGGGDAVARLVAAGVVAAVGHTSADYLEARRAFDRGARVLTHAFNGMRSIHHRAPGPVVAALEDPGVVLELIADGVHVHPAVIGVCAEAARGRVALVSDAMAAAGAADGDYRLGELTVRVRDGIATHGAGDALAGSTLTLDRALATAVAAGMTRAAAVEAVTGVPARLLGLDHLGTLEPGRAADAVLLDERLRVRAVWLDGVCTSERNGDAAAPAF